MKQRDICIADLNPSQGNEQSGLRPVVIISGNAMNDHLNMCIICPLTTQIKNYSGCVVLNRDEINKLDFDSEVITFQIRTITKSRIIKKIGEINEQQLSEIVGGLNDILKF
jgi:mRNA interferase MazF